MLADVGFLLHSSNSGGKFDAPAGPGLLKDKTISLDKLIQDFLRALTSLL